MKKRILWLAYALLGRRLADSLLMEYMNLTCRNKNLRKLIRQNKKFHNIHKGERCFILGNGPSLRDVDLNLLKDEFVFTCNNFSLVKNYKNVKTNVHIWADTSFFEMREDQKYDHEELMENYRKIAEEKPICFFYDAAFDFVKKYNLDQILDVNYYSVFGSFVDSKVRNQFNLANYISGYSTVVQYAISIAVYMGFDEIYLLGCDSTNVASMINCAMGIRNEGMHAYDKDDVNERYTEILNHLKMTDLLYDQYYMFEGYQTLKNECDKRNIKLINCSSKTIVNELPRKELKEVLA